MTVRSAVLGRATSPGGGGALAVFTVPAGETWIIKQVSVWNQSGGGAEVDLYVQPSAGGGLLVFNWTSIANLAIVRWDGWAIADPGDSMIFQTFVGGVHLWVSGAQLLGVAP